MTLDVSLDCLTYLIRNIKSCIDVFSMRPSRPIKPMFALVWYQKTLQIIGGYLIQYADTSHLAQM